MKARPGVNAKSYIREHFQELLGKIYTPYSDPNIYSLALGKEFQTENEALLNQLNKYFIVQECKMGEDPETLFNNDVSEASNGIPTETITSEKMYSQDLSAPLTKNMKCSIIIRHGYIQWKNSTDKPDCCKIFPSHAKWKD